MWRHCMYVSEAPTAQMSHQISGIWLLSDESQYRFQQRPKKEALPSSLPEAGTPSAVEEVAENSKPLSRQPKSKYKSLWDSIRKQFLSVRTYTPRGNNKRSSPPPPPFLSSSSPLAVCHVVMCVKNASWEAFHLWGWNSCCLNIVFVSFLTYFAVLRELFLSYMFHNAS